LSGFEGLLEVVIVLRNKKQGVEWVERSAGSDVGVLRSKKLGVDWVGRPAGRGVSVEEQEARR